MCLYVVVGPESYYCMKSSCTYKYLIQTTPGMATESCTSVTGSLLHQSASTIENGREDSVNELAGARHLYIFE